MKMSKELERTDNEKAKLERRLQRREDQLKKKNEAGFTGALMGSFFGLAGVATAANNEDDHDSDDDEHHGDGDGDGGGGGGDGLNDEDEDAKAVEGDDAFGDGDGDDEYGEQVIGKGNARKIKRSPPVRALNGVGSDR
jgi:hypothetical protein